MVVETGRIADQNEVEVYDTRVPEANPESPKEYMEMADEDFKESDEAFARNVSEITPHGWTVVDIGCGPGNVDRHLALIRPDLLLIMFDLSQEMLDIAEERVREDGFLERFKFHRADMTKLKDMEISTLIPTGPVMVTSLTVFHSLSKPVDSGNARSIELEDTFTGVAKMVGEKGGVLIRDLIRPRDNEQAEQWREEVLKGKKLSPRQHELFDGSQRAGFNEEELRRTLNNTPLAGRGELITNQPSPNSRYWDYVLLPEAA